MKKETSRLSATTIFLADVLLALVLLGLLFGFYSARIFSRVSGEGSDRKVAPGDVLLTELSLIHI